MGLFQAIYSSRPFGYDAQTLAAILLDARRCNGRDGITGALICRRDIYLQLLEGEEASVRATLARILRDDRHANVDLHMEQTTDKRLFGEWDMFHNPSAGKVWSSEEIRHGATHNATPSEVMGFFRQLRREQAGA